MNEGIIMYLKSLCLGVRGPTPLLSAVTRGPVFPLQYKLKSMLPLHWSIMGNVDVGELVNP